MSKSKDEQRVEARTEVAATEKGWPRKVRTTIQPDVDIQVGPEEYLDLARQGLLQPGHDGTDVSA